MLLSSFAVYVEKNTSPCYKVLFFICGKMLLLAIKVLFIICGKMLLLAIKFFYLLVLIY